MGCVVGGTPTVTTRENKVRDGAYIPNPIFSGMSGTAFTPPPVGCDVPRNPIQGAGCRPISG